MPDNETPEPPRTLAEGRTDGETSGLAFVEWAADQSWASAPEVLATYDPDDVRRVREVEAAAQRSVCHTPDGDVLPDDLAEALELRIAVNLAQTGGRDPLVRVGGADSRVRELEAPYSKRRRAES